MSSRSALEERLRLPPLHLDLGEIRAHFRAHPEPVYPVINPAEVERNEPLTRTARAAAVLVLLTPEKDGLHVTLTRRTDDLPKHPGQISFPGGSRDPGDADDVATALREAAEEISLDPGVVEVLGFCGDYYTVTGFRVTPIIATCPQRHAELQLDPDPREVAEILSVPFGHLMTPSKYSVHESRYAGHLRYYYSVTWAGHNVWGATAGILMGLHREFAARDP